jgi:molybdenum cofactor guanylyltransferase
MIYALILAGGQGSRLGGVRKGDLRLGGRTLYDRVSERLRGQAKLLLSGPAGIPDLPLPYGGPLVGLAAAVSHLRDHAGYDDLIVTVAVDTPFLSDDYVSRITAPLGKAQAAQAFSGNRGYPTNAAYRLQAISDLPERVGEIGSPKRLLAALDAVAVVWPESPDPFANLNTLDDLAALHRRLG